LYFLLSSDSITESLSAIAEQSTSAYPSIKPSDIENLEISLPPLSEQKQIATILKSIEDKIALNQQINKNLEKQAQTIYKAWFVDFEPFGGEMPTDWHTGTANEILEFHDAKRVPLSSAERIKMGKIYPYYGATSIMDYVDNYIFDGIYLLLGEDGTVITKDGFPILQYVDGKFWVNNHAHILTGKQGFSVEALYLFFGLTNVKHIVTGAVQPKISQANLKKLEVIIPPANILRKFDEIIQPMFEAIRNQRAENLRLAALRDALLPRLMSGEIDVSGIEI
ncbi:MAG: restriction endonuclease subunit S, partial [Schwartzia sp.]|nr:restriction endonuclease subunit S [Schwartzia sp. (in: firmicutes)]